MCPTPPGRPVRSASGSADMRRTSTRSGVASPAACNTSNSTGPSPRSRYAQVWVGSGVISSDPAGRRRSAGPPPLRYARTATATGASTSIVPPESVCSADTSFPDQGTWNVFRWVSPTPYHRSSIRPAVGGPPCWTGVNANRTVPVSSGSGRTARRPGPASVPVGGGRSRTGSPSTSVKTYSSRWRKSAPGRPRGAIGAHRCRNRFDRSSSVRSSGG